MKVELLQHTSLAVCAHAIRTCWASHDKSDTNTINVCRNCGSHNIVSEYGPTKGFCEDCDSDQYHTYSTCGPADLALIERVGNKHKHQSTLEHLSYTFFISSVSRALLQELARHRMASPSVKSSRYTLKELKSEEPFITEEFLPLSSLNGSSAMNRADKYLVYTGIPKVDLCSIMALENLRQVLLEGISNDRAKYCLPEAYKTELTWTINARSLQNFLHLRSNPAALWEIRDLAQAVYDALPDEHKYLFEESLYDGTDSH